MNINELKHYSSIIRKVEQLFEEYEKFKTRAEKITPTISDTTSRTNLTSDKVGDNAVELAELDKKYKKLLLEAELQKFTIIDALNGMPEPCRSILFMKYVQQKSLETIADELGYSFRHIKRLYNKAIEIYEKMSPNVT